MCGIVGFAGPADGVDALIVVMEGLRRMEYRGYDSAGIVVQAVDDQGHGVLCSRKKAGKLANLDAALSLDPLPLAVTAVGHTRWATHGGPTDLNAHPHMSADGRLALVHNGIIENYAALRVHLADEGVTCVSETDTEVAAHLVARAYDELGNLTEAMRVVCNPSAFRRYQNGQFLTVFEQFDHDLDHIFEASIAGLLGGGRWAKPLKATEEAKVEFFAILF